MKLQIIQLEAHDDVASVRDRLAFVRAERVLLVWPRDMLRPILARKLDLVLIQREAARRGVWLALVTSEPPMMDLARDLNIATFPSVRASQRGRWTKPISKVFVDRADRPDNAPDPYELMLHASRLKVLSPAQRRTRQMIRALGLVVMVVAVVSTLYLLVPGAYVSLTPAQDQINKTVSLTIDPAVTEIQVERGRIPGTLVTLDVEAQTSIRTTGQIDVPSTLASGTALFINRIESEVQIPGGTILSTPGTRPARFRTVSDAVVPKGVGKTVSVTIQATDDTAGTRGNIEPNLIINIEGDLARLLSVRNPEATQGGTVREQKLVTRADVDNLAVLAQEKLRQDALAEFARRLGSNQQPIQDSFRIINAETMQLTYSAFVGDPADTLGVTIRASVQALVVDQRAANQAALARLTADIPPGRRLILDSVAYKNGPIQYAREAGTATIVIAASGNVAAYIDVERARQRIAGLSVEAATAILNREWLLDPRQPPQINISPFFFWQLPILPARISIEVRK